MFGFCRMLPLRHRPRDGLKPKNMPPKHIPHLTTFIQSEVMASNAQMPFQPDSDHHGHTPRLFIGPMPVATAKKIVPHIGTHKKHSWFRLRLRKRRSGQNEVEVEDGDQWVVEENVPDTEAFRFFLHKGGRREEWSSRALRKRVKREMIKMIRQSGWGNLFGQKNVQAPAQKWIGGTFVIGKDVLGIPLGHHTLNLDDMPPVSSVSRNSEDTESVIRDSNAYSTVSVSSTNNGSPAAFSSTTALVQPSSSRQVRSLSPERPVTPGPSTPPRPTKAFQSAPDAMSLSPGSLKFALHQPGENESGIGRSIQFTGTLGPASPRKVLNRAPDEVPLTSAEAMEQNYGTDSVVRRERMLIRRGYTKSGRVGRYFSAVEASSLRDLRSYEWQEFLVVWRKKQLELYEDYTVPGKEKLLRHKHLACTIPLDEQEARVSLYSFIDLSFCLTCSERVVTKGENHAYRNIVNRVPFLRSNGTFIFIFKTKVRTSAIDWLWDLWKELDYDLPPTLEVHCPLIDGFVRLRIPERGIKTEDDMVFSKENVIDRSCNGLKALPSWDLQVKQRLEGGASIELCWRNEAVLDRIQWDTDLNGKTRDASVMYGLCLKRPHEMTRLELRIGEHHPSYVVKDGQEIPEPSPIEGYLYRLKKSKSSNNTHTRSQVYLSVHMGCLFVTTPAKAHPPVPPFPTGGEILAHDSGKKTKLSFREEEKRRGTAQVLHADFFLDIRKIAAIRRAFQPSDDYRDDLDGGGDESLSQHSDIPKGIKATLRFRRTFELLTQGGHLYRFETYSCSFAQQWVDRLRELVNYWTQRRRADATREMKIIGAFSSGKDRRYSLGLPQFQPVEPEHISEDISLFWDCGAAHGCQSVIRTGRLFTRRGLKGKYSLVQLALVTGHIVQFNILSAGQNPRSSTISLLDAYVCSGHFATQSLSVKEFSPINPPIPRRFQDGLESGDHEFDLVFLVWYRPYAPKKALVDGHGVAIPAINAKHKIIIFKARSKLERDAWCWAINDEIERTARHHVSRELKSRQGGLADI